MTILHIAGITDDKCAGVNVAVPQHIIAQQSVCDVAFLNVFPVKADGVQTQFNYSKGFMLKNLPSPYCKPDLIVFHEIYRYPFIKLYKEALKLKIPYIVVPHGGLTKTAQSKKSWKKRPANVLLFNRYLKKAAGIHYLSKNEKSNSVFKGESIVVPNGVFLPSTVTHNQNKELVFAYIGRLEIDIKGLDLLLNAIKSVSAQLRKGLCKFNIYGPEYAGEKEVLAEMIKTLGIEDLVVVHPPVFGAEKVRILSSTDVYIQTSRTEGMPMGIVEAMTYGIPCAVTVGTGMGDFVCANGCGWVSKNTAKDIADMILQVVNDKNLHRQKGDNGAKVSAATFSWDSVAAQTVAKYADLCGLRGVDGQ
ncbi:MAG: glycosyltransferase [Clostridia bacterium]|nr:glycosyltransferase [Clostridia bacterium]